MGSMVIPGLWTVVFCLPFLGLLSGSGLCQASCRFREADSRHQYFPDLGDSHHPECSRALSGIP